MWNYYDWSAEWGLSPGACQSWKIKMRGLNNSPQNCGMMHLFLTIVLNLLKDCFNTS